MRRIGLPVVTGILFMFLYLLLVGLLSMVAAPVVAFLRKVWVFRLLYLPVLVSRGYPLLACAVSWWVGESLLKANAPGWEDDPVSVGVFYGLCAAFLLVITVGHLLKGGLEIVGFEPIFAGVMIFELVKKIKANKRGTPK